MSFGMAPVGFASDLIATVDQLRLELFGGTPPPILFHYTSWRGVVGITNSRSLRATCVADLKDVSELQHGADLIHEEAANVARRSHSPWIRAVLPLIAHHARRRTRRTFVACFCGSSASKFHWKSYGHYCLRLETLSKHEPLLRPVLPKAYVSYHKVIYEEVQQRDAIRRAVATVAQALARSTWGVPHGHGKDSIVHFLARGASEFLLDLIVAFKRPVYAEDSEWRIVVRPWPRPLSSAPDWEDADFASLIRTEQTQQYVELQVPAEAVTFVPLSVPRVPFSAVTQSPFDDTPAECSLIRRTLDENGCTNIKIAKAEVIQEKAQRTPELEGPNLPGAGL